VRLRNILLLCALPAFAADMKPGGAQWVEDLGGSVAHDAQGRVTGVNLRGTWVSDTDMKRLAAFPDITSLDLSLTHITDQGMQEIKGLRNIVDLNVAYAEYLTDEGMAVMRSATHP